MGQINVLSQNNTSGENPSMGGGASANASNSSSSSQGQSISMFDWQYDLQKKLQKPTIINYTEQEHGEKAKDALIESKEKQERGEIFH